MRVAYLALCLALISTFVATYRVRENVEAHDRIRFEKIIREAQVEIERRFSQYVDELYGVRGMLAANSATDREAWDRYFASVEMLRRNPGIRSIGYLERVDAANKTAFLRQQRKTQSDYRAFPDSVEPVLFPVVYLTAFDAEVRSSLGFDHFTEPERRAVMEQARDMGRAFATSKLKFVALDGKHYGSGLIIYLPVFRNGAPVATSGQRRQALQGFIFTTLAPERLLSGVLGPQSAALVNLEVYDGRNIAPDHLLFGDVNVGNGQGSARLRKWLSIAAPNHPWTAVFQAKPAFASESQRYLIWVMLAGGFIISALLFGITWAEVTTREQAERNAAEIQKSEAALAAEKERLAVTLYSISDGVITTDAVDKIVSMNKVAEQLTGWKLAEAGGKPLGEVLRLMQEQTRERAQNLVTEIARSGKAVELSKYNVLLARDGTERGIMATAAPIQNKAGTIIGVVLVFRDVTEKRKTDEELLREKKLESVGLLAGGIAHDFNNILLGIMGNISLARLSSHSAEKLKERLASVEKAALRARELTQQLLTFAKGGEPIRVPVQLGEMIKEVCQSTLEGSNVKSEFGLPADSWPAEADEGQLRQVLTNLFVNAMQAMPRGGNVEVRLENVTLTHGFLPPLAAGKYVKISIRDHGEGIRPEHLPRIFEPYFSTRKQGNGLGLATAYSVVRKHDGQIKVESSVGAGTTFHIYLPAADEKTSESEERVQKKFFGEGRLLVMDDEAEILTIVQEMLQSLGYEVETAKDGSEAIEKYVKAKVTGRPYEAIMMDLTIPNGMGGREAVTRLREFDPGVKAVVSSGYSFDPVMANYRQFGFRGIIPKPYRIEELGRVLSEVVAKTSI